MAEQFDLVVVGTGAGGSAPASRCRAAGWRVAVVDDQPYGGTCELRGCDPKKVLAGAAEIVAWHRRMRGCGVAGEAAIDWPALMQFKRTFTDPAPPRHQRAFEQAGIVTYHGRARFTDESHMLITAVDEHGRGEEIEIEARYVLLASGAEPVPLAIAGEEHVRTSTDFLDLETMPASVAFIGAGYVSFEFAHIVARAGARAVVLGRGAPLGHFDQDVVARLVAHTRDVGVDLRDDVDVVAVERHNDHYRVHFTDGSRRGVVDADLVIHGGGRRPRTRALDLARGNVATDDHGAVTVNEFLQSSSNPRVYAAGDCVLPAGSLPLTPVAMHEGLVAASNLLHGNTRTPDYRGIPSVVFTTPPLAGVGLTEVAAREQQLDVQVRCEDTGGWFSNRRVREPAAMFKTVVQNGTDRVVGAHLLGPDAADVINIFALAVRHGLTAAELKHMIYAYPTSASDVAYML